MQDLIDCAKLLGLDVTPDIQGFSVGNGADFAYIEKHAGGYVYYSKYGSFLLRTKKEVLGVLKGIYLTKEDK
jgi:hypothetical protein